MTARNLQEEAKAKGLPWSAAKGAPPPNPLCLGMCYFDTDAEKVTTPFFPLAYVSPQTSSPMLTMSGSN
jgi:hypothetical protein